MEAVSDLLGCFEDQWASCSQLLQDMTRQEQAMAAYRVINDTNIKAFLPSTTAR